MPMLHEYSSMRRSRDWIIMNVQSVLFKILTDKKNIF